VNNRSMSSGLILGIESSCDETAAAVVRVGSEVLSSAVASQLAAHQPYGGVVPELAAREHLRAIVPVVRKALTDAKVELKDLDAIAVTQGPGLAGALLVGITYAKTLAYAAEKPLIAVNHLEGHIHAVLIEEHQRGAQIEFPLVSLVVSGGHTHLYLCELHDERSAESKHHAAYWSYECIGRTRDDAAGEAFDKVAKLLGLGYPGGPLIDQLAAHGDAHAVQFAPIQIKGRPRKGGKKKQPQRADGGLTHDFSYSGIKTAVLRYVELHSMKTTIEARREQLAQMEQPTLQERLALCDKPTLNLIASFQNAVVQDVVKKTLVAAEEMSARTLFVTGGVAANSLLRATFEKKASQAGVRVAFPSRVLSTDNAAMIAAAAYPKLIVEDFADMQMGAQAALSLG
jgi:N6-L-threonylcarbamoyladenine synthase